MEGSSGEYICALHDKILSTVQMYIQEAVETTIDWSDSLPRDRWYLQYPTQVSFEAGSVAQLGGSMRKNRCKTCASTFGL